MQVDAVEFDVTHAVNDVSNFLRSYLSRFLPDQYFQRTENTNSEKQKKVFLGLGVKIGSLGLEVPGFRYEVQTRLNRDD